MKTLKKNPSLVRGSHSFINYRNLDLSKICIAKCWDCS